MHLTDINHLNLSFNELPEINSIIFGYNGVGKTSIYKALQTNSDISADFLDFETTKADFKKKGKEIFISANINEILCLNNEKSDIIEKINYTTALKNIDIKSQKNAARIGLKDEYSNKVILSNENINEDYLNIVKDSTLNLSWIVQNSENFDTINDLKYDIEKAKQRYLEKTLEDISNSIEDDTNICPVCGSEVKNLKELIISKKNEIQDYCNTVIKKYVDDNIGKNDAELEDDINNINELTSLKLDKKTVVDSTLLATMEISYKEYNKKIVRLNEIEEQLEPLVEKRNEMYDHLVQSKEYINNILKKMYKVNESNIIYNGEKHQVEVKMPRKVDTYSVGELNFLIFLIYINEFLTNDNEYIIIDDPLSSYDLINQYKVIFELIKLSGSNKKVIIFTHNIEMINMIQSQDMSVFKYYSLESINKKVHFLEIAKEEQNPIMALEYILNIDECDKEYIQTLINREQEPHGEINKIFHYDGPEGEYTNDGLSNDYLANKIDDYLNNPEIDLSKLDFKELAHYKVMMLISLRVWIERKIFEFLNDNQKSQFKETFYKKINRLFPRTGDNMLKNKGFENSFRETLLSKKVMLNQNSHYGSQIYHFNYALNISVDALHDEIKEIVELFPSNS